jgi:hypothetical protein
MFSDQELSNYIDVNNTLKLESLVISEWNLNDLEKISNYGNYRYRPNGSSVQFLTVPNIYDSSDLGNHYTDNLESNTISSYAVNNNNEELLFTSPEKDRELYYSLKECFQNFRPRSGINKPLWIDGKYIDGIRSASRPRYYMSSRSDQFKYWNSYKKDMGVERGISNTSELENNVGYAIEDAVPFVVYNKSLPTNRIVVKLQTNLADSNPVTIRTKDGGSIVDPLTDINSSSIPKRWSIEYLNQNNQWIEAINFNENSTRIDGSNIVDWDGYVEIFYGIKIPDEYRGSFNLVASLSSSSQLTNALVNGESYLIGSSESDPGLLYIWNYNNGDWDRVVPQYGFSLCETDDTKKIGIVKNLVDPEYFILNNDVVYREFVFINGLRLKVDTLYGPKNTFDLIELSPRLKSDISKYVSGYDFNKSIALVDTSLPVGGLIASNGNVVIMNHDGAFSKNNGYNKDLKLGSLVADLLQPNIKFDFYEAVLNVNGYDKFIPIKTFYSEDFPLPTNSTDDISVSVRDNFFRLETMNAPTLFLKNITLTAAVAILLDNIGFSNYVFKNLTNSTDPIIPYFFVEPDITVAEVLQRLAVATQTAMFFDEYNNFVVMSKEYLLPNSYERETDLVLYGQKTGESQPNIINITSGETKIINDGQINYTTRYIQRSAASLNQATNVDEDRTYIYKPVLLWEVSSQEESKTINEKSKQVGYSLGAAALNSDLSDIVPSVENNQIINNIIDLGENIYWLPRFFGYLYSNGEIIRYDAVEYVVFGGVNGQTKVWISSNKEYQKYFASLPFNGKMYPTGNIRIYCEPLYEELEYANVTGLEPGVSYKNGEVNSHGRGQFGTKIAYHHSGLNSYWSDNNNVRGCRMDSQYIFSTKPTENIVYPSLPGLVGTAGIDNTTAQKSNRNGIVANFMRQNIPADDYIKSLKSTSSGTIQSSALVFSGPSPMPSDIIPKDFISYVYKNFDNDNDYKHFGTRMRIIGKSEASTKIQTPNNASEYFVVQSQGTDPNVTISGGSGGIGVMVNSENNYGYFFEICSLTTDNLSQYTTIDKNTGETLTVLHNLIFYKLVPGTTSLQAVPVKLWGGLTQILVDEGKFVGMNRLSNEENPTVYDLAVEYETIGNSKRFYLYLNNVMIAIVDDNNPLPSYNSAALFVRGSSKCMFENVYGLKSLRSKETGTPIIRDINQAFSNNEIVSSEALRKYAMSGLVQSTYLSGISSENAPKYDMYFEEFGTIMRECAYFNIKYDQAYPAFLAYLAPTFNKEKTYTSSGFYAGSYGAEFLIFNATDKAVVLDETSGNYLRIIGVTFTQNTSQVLTVDDYFRQKSNFSDPIVVNNTITSPQRADKVYQSIKESRSKYGKKSFSLDSYFIQNEDTANDLMNWLINKTLRQRKSINIETFGTPHLQLGDIVTIDYDLSSNNRTYKFVDVDTKFVVHSINYSRGYDGPSISIGVIEA